MSGDHHPKKYNSAAPCSPASLCGLEKMNDSKVCLLVWAESSLGQREPALGKAAHPSVLGKGWVWFVSEPHVTKVPRVHEVSPWEFQSPSELPSYYSSTTGAKLFHVGKDMALPLYL
jgi:hypothetical protein